MCQYSQYFDGNCKLKHITQYNWSTLIQIILVIRLPIHFWIDLGFVEVEVREYDLNSFTGIGVKIISARDVRWVRVGIPRATYRTLGGGSLSDILVAFGWNQKKIRITISI